MFSLILFLFSLLVILASVATGLVIVYHFKRFGIKNDLNVKRFLNIFEIGGGIIIVFNLILLFFIVL